VIARTQWPNHAMQLTPSARHASCLALQPQESRRTQGVADPFAVRRCSPLAMNPAQTTVRQFVALLVSALFAGAVPSAFAKAYYATEDEMIERAEVIAIVNVARVENAETKAEPFNYSEIAHATVEQTLKATLPQTVKLHGGESFICAQVHFTPGRHLVFLRRHG
jgi:hypothetical protein